MGNLVGANLDDTRFDHDGSPGTIDLHVQESVLDGVFSKVIVSSEDNGPVNHEAKINIDGANLDDSRFDHDGSLGNIDLHVQESVLDGFFSKGIVPFEDNGP